VEEPWKDRLFDNKRSLVVVNTNDVHHKLVDDRAWVHNKALNTWNITRGCEQCSKVLNAR
jgi:hypothetical protein